MVLRRITEHVNAQNWFAVGLDLVIVVVGDRLPDWTRGPEKACPSSM